MAASRPYALMPGEGREIDLVSVLEATERPGFGPPAHVRHDCCPPSERHV